MRRAHEKLRQSRKASLLRGLPIGEHRPLRLCCGARAHTEARLGELAARVALDPRCIANPKVWVDRVVDVLVEYRSVDATAIGHAVLIARGKRPRAGNLRVRAVRGHQTRLESLMGSAMKPERLPRWKDVAVFVIVGLTYVVIAALSRDPSAALRFAEWWGCLTALLVVTTAVRQRNRPFNGRR